MKGCTLGDTLIVQQSMAVVKKVFKLPGLLLGCVENKLLVARFYIVMSNFYFSFFPSLNIFTKI